MPDGLTLTASVSTNKLNAAFKRLARETNQSEIEVLREAGTMVGNLLVRYTPPKNERSGKASAEKSVRHSFMVQPKKMISKSRANFRSKFGRKGEASNVRWLYATPRLIVGINPENLIDEGNTDDLLKRHYQMAAIKGKIKRKMVQVGKHGKQAEMLIKEPMISRKLAAQLSKIVAEKFGKLKASWAKAFSVAIGGLNSRIEVPGFAVRHLSSAKGTGSTDFVSQNPTITFESKSAGVESQPSRKAMKRAIGGAANFMKRKLEAIKLKQAGQRAGM